MERGRTTREQNDLYRKAFEERRIGAGVCQLFGVMGDGQQDWCVGAMHFWGSANGVLQ